MERQSTVARDGVHLDYKSAGSGTPALVFVHGWSCDMEHWREQLELFSSKHRVVALDLAGHGASGRNRENWDIEHFADDVLGVMDAEQVDEAVLIGHSMGGLVVTEVAAKAPSRVIGLVPVDTLQNVEQLFPPGALDGLLAAMQADFHAAAGGFIDSLFVADSDPKLKSWVLDRVAKGDPKALIAALGGARDYDLLPRLERVEAPVHSINSDMQPTNFEAARRHLPHFDADIMSGLAHFPQLEDPAGFNERLTNIVDGWSGQA